MRITILLLFVGFCLVNAKYLSYEPSDSNTILLRHKRSDSDESFTSVDDDDGDDDEDTGENDSLEKKLKELEIKRREKEEKAKRKLEEKQRKLEEKRLKNQRKEEEKREKEERKRQEKIEKEKQKDEEKRQKQLEKEEKENKKKEEKERKELEKIRKELNEESDSDDFLNTEEESSIELSEIWRHHIYVKYGLNLSSTQLEKQAALSRYLQEELGLSSNSTETERREAVIKLIQTQIQNNAGAPDGLNNQLLSHLNAISIQKLRTKLDKDIEKLSNKSAILSNVNLTWASEAQQQLEGKRTLLQTIAQFLSSVVPNWWSGSSPIATPSANAPAEQGVVNINSNSIGDSGSANLIPASVVNTNEESATGTYSITNINAPGIDNNAISSNSNSNGNANEGPIIGTNSPSNVNNAENNTPLLGQVSNTNNDIPALNTEIPVSSPVGESNSGLIQGSGAGMSNTENSEIGNINSAISNINNSPVTQNQVPANEVGVSNANGESETIITVSSIISNNENEVSTSTNGNNLIPNANSGDKLNNSSNIASSISDTTSSSNNNVGVNNAAVENTNEIGTVTPNDNILLSNSNTGVSDVSTVKPVIINTTNVATTSLNTENVITNGITVVDVNQVNESVGDTIITAGSPSDIAGINNGVNAVLSSSVSDAYTGDITSLSTSSTNDTVSNLITSSNPESLTTVNNDNATSITGINNKTNIDSNVLNTSSQSNVASSTTAASVSPANDVIVEPIASETDITTSPENNSVPESEKSGGVSAVNNDTVNTIIGGSNISGDLNVTSDIPPSDTENVLSTNDASDFITSSNTESLTTVNNDNTTSITSLNNKTNTDSNAVNSISQSNGASSTTAASVSPANDVIVEPIASETDITASPENNSVPESDKSGGVSAVNNDTVNTIIGGSNISGDFNVTSDIPPSATEKVLSTNGASDFITSSNPESLTTVNNDNTTSITSLNNKTNIDSNAVNTISQSNGASSTTAASVSPANDVIVEPIASGIDITASPENNSVPESDISGGVSAVNNGTVNTIMGGSNISGDLNVPSDIPPSATENVLSTNDASDANLAPSNLSTSESDSTIIPVLSTVVDLIANEISNVVNNEVFVENGTQSEISNNAGDISSGGNVVTTLAPFKSENVTPPATVVPVEGVPIVVDNSVVNAETTVGNSINNDSTNLEAAPLPQSSTVQEQVPPESNINEVIINLNTVQGSTPTEAVPINKGNQAPQEVTIALPAESLLSQTSLPNEEGASVVDILQQK